MSTHVTEAPTPVIEGAIRWADVPTNRKRWFVWIFVFLFSPVAIYLAWSGPVYRRVADLGVPYRRGAQVGFGVVVLALLVVGIIDPAKTNASSPSGSGPGPAVQVSPATQNERYFTRERFVNPNVLKALYEKDQQAIRQLPQPVQDAVLVYVRFVSKEMENRCGPFLTAGSTFKQGVLDIAMVVQTFASIPADSRNAFRDWVGNVGSLEDMNRQGKRDVTVFLQDHGGCGARQAFNLQDGIEGYFRAL